MRFRIPIRGKIILTLLVPLIVVLIILAITGTDMINTGVKDVAREQEASLAFMISERLSDNLDRYPSLLTGALPETGDENPDPARIREELTTIKDSGTDLIFDQGVGVYSGSGELVSHTSYPESGTWNNIGGEIASRTVMERRAVYSLLRNDSAPPYFSLYIPVFSESGTTSIIEGRISPEYSLFGSMLVNVLEIQKGTAGYAVLIDHNGNILYQRFQGDLYEGRDAALAEFFSRSGMNQNSSVILTSSITGKEHYAGYHPVPGTEWGVIAYEDRKVILHTLDQYLNLTLLMIIGAMVITLLLIIILINRILSPIPVLINRVQKVKEGTLEPFSFPGYQDEIGILADEFNKMVVSLKGSFKDLDTAKKRYQSILNQAYDGILILDAKTLNILESNRMVRTITGYTREQLTMAPFPTLLLSPEMGGFGDIIRKLTSEGMKQEYLGEILRSDGSLRYAEINLTRIHTEGQEFIQATIRDITSRREAEINLLKKTEELDRFFSVSLDLLCITDMKGGFRRVNPEWEVTLGYPLRDLNKKRISDIVYQEDQETLKEAMSALVKGTMILNLEVRMLCSNGSFRWIQWRSVPFGDLIYSSARDITARKEADEKIRAGIQMIAHNQETLAILNDQIRNPLTLISILNETDDPERVEKIHDAVRRIDDIINQLDKGWLMSDKVRRIMMKHYEMADELS